METLPLQLTPEMRAALIAHPGEALHIADKETGKIYLVVEQGVFPGLEAEYIRDGLDLAREQIARGQVSTASITQIVAKAKQQQPAKS
jgi:hypothetical protein